MWFKSLLTDFKELVFGQYSKLGGFWSGASLFSVLSWVFYLGAEGSFLAAD